jgi:hypothetical protein
VSADRGQSTRRAGSDVDAFQYLMGAILPSTSSTVRPVLLTHTQHAGNIGHPLPESESFGLGRRLSKHFRQVRAD